MNPGYLEPGGVFSPIRLSRNAWGSGHDFFVALHCVITLPGVQVVVLHCFHRQYAWGSGPIVSKLFGLGLWFQARSVI